MYIRNIFRRRSLCSKRFHGIGFKDLCYCCPSQRCESEPIEKYAQQEDGFCDNNSRWMTCEDSTLVGKTERWQKKSIFGSVKPCHCVLLRVSLLRGDTFLRGDVVVFHMGGGLPHIKRNVSPTKNAHFDVLLYMRRASSCVLCRGKTSCGLYPSSFWVKKNRRSNTARHIVFYHYELVCTAAAKWVPLFMGPFEGWCHWEATCSPLRGLLWHSCTPAACLVYSHFTYFSGLLLLFDWCQGAPLMASHQPCIYLSTVPF